MKNLFIIFLTVSTCTFSQKYLDSIFSFKLEKSNIIWQKVFESEEQTAEIITQLTIAEFTNKLTFTENKIFGRTEKHPEIALKYLPYFATFGFDTFLTIEIKEGRIRATAKEITFDGPTITVFGVEQKQDYPLFDNVLKKGKIKNTKANRKVLKALDSILNSKFLLKEIKKDEW